MADQSPAAKDAAIATLAGLEPDIHWETAYGILRADLAFDPESFDDRVYVADHWPAAAAEGLAKKQQQLASPT